MYGRTRLSRDGNTLVPSATRRAKTRPYGVRAAMPLPYSRRSVARVCSKIRTPWRRQASLRPQASLAGWTIATPSLSQRPPRKVGEFTSARSWSASRTVMSRPYRATASATSWSSSTWWGWVATSISPVRSHSASMPWRLMVSSMASRLAAPRRSSWPSSEGQRSRPLPKPWVRLAAQNPPLRPEAAHPTSLPSTSTTSSAGSRSLAMRAVHRPE